MDEVNAVIKESIESTIQNAPYHHGKVGQWNTNIVEICLKKLTGLNKPFKYIATCTIMQKNGAGLHAASSCYWDNASDGIGLCVALAFLIQSISRIMTKYTGSTTYKYDSKTMYVIVNVYGLAI